MTERDKFEELVPVTFSPWGAWLARADLAAKREHELQAKITEQALQIVSAFGETQNALDRVAELEKDAACYRWLIANWGRIVTDTCWNGIDEPRGVKAIELGPKTLGSVDPESLHRAICRTMEDAMKVQP